MAIAWRGAKTYTVAASTTGTTTVSLTDILDSSGSAITLAQNDFVIINHGTSDTGDTVFSAPTNWTQREDNWSDSTHDTNNAIWYQIMGATPDTSVDVPNSGGSTSSGGGTIHVFSGVDTTTPFDVADVIFNNPASGGNPNASAITPTTVGACIFVTGAAAHGSGVENWTQPSDLDSSTNAFQSVGVNGSGHDTTIGAGFSLNWSSGTFNPVAWTGSGATGSSASYIAGTFALRPASGGGGGTQTLTPSLFDDSTDTFYSATVSATYSLTPALFDETTDTFFSATASARYTLTPSLFSNTNTFYGPVETNRDTLLPSLFSNTNTFYSATVSAGGVTQNLTASLFTNTNTFQTALQSPIGFKGYTLSNASGLTSDLTIFMGSPDAFTTLDFNTYTLQPNDFVIGIVTVGAGSDLTITTSNSGWTKLPEIYKDGTWDTNAAVFYKHFNGGTPDSTFVVTGGAQDTNNSISCVFFAFSGVDPSSPLDVIPTSTTGTDTTRADFPAITPATTHSLVLGLSSAAGDNIASIGGFSNDPFMTAAISLVGNSTYDTAALMGINQASWSSGTVDPPALTSGPVFAGSTWGAYTVALRPNNPLLQHLTPSLFSNTNTFYGATVNTIWHLLPSLFSNNNTFYAPTLHQLGVPIHPPLFVNTNLFYSPQLGWKLHQAFLFKNYNAFYEVNTFNQRWHADKTFRRGRYSETGPLPHSQDNVRGGISSKGQSPSFNKGR